jgi:hypothetical protein
VDFPAPPFWLSIVSVIMRTTRPSAIICAGRVSSAPQPRFAKVVPTLG